jgi:hypothetical protein
VIYFFLLFIEIVILFLLSRAMSRTLSEFLSMNIIAVIFLPGVIIHELSHLFIATVMFVPVGRVEFLPKKENNKLKLGSVEIAKTDPFRRAIIGFAPIFIGLAIIVGSVWLFSHNISFLQSENYDIFIAVSLILAYLLFAISNTMFSSSRDTEGTAEILITLVVISILAYVLGFRFHASYLDKILTKEVVGVIQESVIFLIAPIVIDMFALGAVKLFKNREG